MKFRIPSKLQLGATTINVVKVDKCSDTTTDTDGQAFYGKSLIELKKDDTFSDDYKEWVFFHELVHHIFNSMEELELRKNEKLVGQFATFMQQAIRTME